MRLGPVLEKLGDRLTFPPAGQAERRWGQILRESPGIAQLLAKASGAGLLTPLDSLAEVRSGVVPRANAYFVVRELKLDEIPSRFHITKRDHSRVTVIEDGLKTLHRCERLCLRPVVKGPDGLLGPSQVALTDQRLFDVGDRSKEDLRRLRANGTLAYLRRGETVYYKVSDDSLKGGIPAQRSNTRNRKPFWYSLHSPPKDKPRIVVPEHFDKRFVATLLSPGQDAVVIDTLYSIAPRKASYAPILLASLNSLLVWYQLEMRGRTQHGEGVLKVKVADWKQILVLDPARLSNEDTQAFTNSFSSTRTRETANADLELANPDRLEFDVLAFALCGAQDAELARTDAERQLRAAMGERHERAHSMDAAKAGRAATKRVTASADAYASRIAADLESYPDPRTFLNGTEETSIVLVAGRPEGRIILGDDLFSQGDIFSGGRLIASAGDIRSAQYVRGVLLHDPDLTAVSVPREPSLSSLIAGWEEAVAEWQVRFDECAAKVLKTIDDKRLAAEIKDRAKSLLHAD